ncbi:glycoside hydrolase family 13 protein [Pseudokineococcus sp. 1T1Z-3]|uniref:glycoside hydrolase family 13 protein n=1 Tax=Pseudokineococcus sp. 1T1Z-3 TaxID=3132745 RepID=UPI0030A75D2D
MGTPTTDRPTADASSTDLSSAGPSSAGPSSKVQASGVRPRVLHAPDGAGPGPGPAPWWTSAVVYQVYPRSFADSDGDGVGDLRGITSRLDHLADLGVDVVWLSPVYASPQDDNGYDISDYHDVDPTFGTLADLDELTDALHARGMRLVMDLVVNHTSDEHPWFVESRSGAGSEKRDWYWWRAPRDGLEAGAPGAEPTNWRSAFSGPAWTLDETSGEYYLHLFSRKQPDLNWENPQVRGAVHAMMRWWLDRGVDGFRMDVINFVSKAVGADGALPDGAGPDPATGLADGGEHFRSGPRVHEYLAEMHAEVFADRPEALLAVGEMPGVGVQDARLFTDPARAEVDMVFQFEHVDLDHVGSKWQARPLDLRDLKASFGRWQEGLAERGWNSLYWNNHDQPRVVSRWGDDSPEHRAASARCLGTLLHLHRGTPYVYQGEEIGMASFPWSSPEQLRDIESVNHLQEQLAAGVPVEDVLPGVAFMSRDNARTPVQWDGSPHAGFTSGEPWIAVNPDHREWNVAAQADDPHSVLAHYRRLVALRHTWPVVALGDLTTLLPEHEQVYAFTRRLEGAGEDGEPAVEELLVVANVSSTPVDLAELLPEAVGAELVLGSEARTDTAEPVLRPWEARVLRLP